MLECRTVSSARELDEWVALTDVVYADTPQFVPPLRQQIRDIHGGKSPTLRYGSAELLSVVRDGAVVGRTTAHANTKLDAKLGERLLLFGFTEFVEDDDVLATLVDALDARARALGADALFGPVNLLPNQSGGVVTSGFEERGFVDSPYNHAYYPGAYERLGFERRFEGETFVLARLGEGPPPDERFPFDAAREIDDGLRVVQANPKRLQDELPFVRELLNASFAQRGYYTEIDEAEFAHQVDGLGYLIDPRIALYLYKADRPIGFVLCIPDISPFVQRIDGDLGLVNQLRLLLTRGRYRREAICVIQGVVPAEQGNGYLRLLWRELLRNLRDAGYHTLRGTFVEHANVASSSYADRLGRPAHGVTFYRRPVA